jgi:outer membrane murein-binding lipoprotein Lpp
MSKFLIIIITSISIILAGCANFNPRNNPKIENKSGKIEDIRTNQNGLMLELAKIRQDITAQNSKLKEIQSGLVNINAAVSRNENTGIQIIQGDLICSANEYNAFLFIYVFAW